jgi:poly(3-hydroxybutyrate) depolymerase
MTPSPALPTLLLALVGCPGPGEETGAPSHCDGQPGTQLRQTLMVDGEERSYLIHAPDDYSCEAAWPLVLDLHGASGAEADGFAPEEVGELVDLVAHAEAEGYLLVRPRSGYISWGDWRSYQWDANPGEIEANRRFIHALVDQIRAHYHVDEARLYVTGVSSGADMATQLLDDAELGIDGLGAISGGSWNDPGFTDLSASSARIFLSTGYRDPSYTTHRWLVDILDYYGHPTELRATRATDAAHRRYPWQLEEQWAWLNRGDPADPGTLAGGWTQENFTGSTDLLQLAETPTGELLAGASDGEIWRRAAGSWELVTTLSDIVRPAWTGLCIGPDGHGVIVGEARVATTSDGGESWEVGEPIPVPSTAWADLEGRMVSAACTDSHLLTVGHWGASVSLDGGESWDAASIEASWDFPAEVASVTRSDAGTWIATGLYYLGRSDDGVDFSPSTQWFGVDWLNDAAAAPGGLWWVVGEAGSIWSSDDDGISWIDRSVPGADDLYAVSFLDAQQGMAVGLHGTALYTADGGRSWDDVSTGLDAFLGDLHWIDDETVLVVGEGGAALTWSPP